MESAKPSLPIYTRGAEVLKQKAKAVEVYTDPEFQNFIDELIRSGDENMGVGIAAPQVGNSLRVFILAPKPSSRYPDSPTMEPMAIINPHIIRQAGEIHKDWEGCLSIPGYRGLVPRHTEIEVTFTTRHGEEIHTTYHDFIARIFQHEYDHLEGILYSERMDAEDTLLSLEEFAALTGISLSK